MVKEEKTIDGFPVRSAKDSALVARSKAKQLAKKKIAQKPVAKKARPAQTKRRPVVVRDLEKTTVTKREERKVAHEEFLAPVETFDFSEEKSKEERLEEGQIEEVEAEEVADLKKDYKALKRVEKEMRKREKKQKKKSKKIIKIVLLILLLIILGGGAYVYFWGNGILKKLTGGEADVWSAIGALTSEKYEPLKTDENGRTNILVLGTSGYDMDGSEGDSVHAGAQLTDSIMVVSFDQENGDLAMVSLPRDLKAGRTCTATGKVNEVYWCNNMYGGGGRGSTGENLRDSRNRYTILCTYELGSACEYCRCAWRSDGGT